MLVPWTGSRQHACPADGAHVTTKTTATTTATVSVQIRPDARRVTRLIVDSTASRHVTDALWNKRSSLRGNFVTLYDRSEVHPAATHPLQSLSTFHLLA